MSDECQHEVLHPVWIPGHLFAVSCANCLARWKVERQTLDSKGVLIDARH